MTTSTVYLSDLAKTHTVTMDCPDEGEATEARTIQLVRINPYEKMVGSLIALKNDGSIWECHDGCTAWNEVEGP